MLSQRTAKSHSVCRLCLSMAEWCHNLQRGQPTGLAAGPTKLLGWWRHYPSITHPCTLRWGPDMDRNLVGRVPGYSSHCAMKVGLAQMDWSIQLWGLFMDELNQSLVPLVGPFSFRSSRGRNPPVPTEISMASLVLRLGQFFWSRPGGDSPLNFRALETSPFMVHLSSSIWVCLKMGYTPNEIAS